jgi:tRNA-intron endonuclease|tara:strand:+ start:280 stop:816 length:537 start_codon:yes stop_codon:yes gene_type:complete
LKSELIENRLIIWNLSDSKKLFSNGYYGKPIGIPKPKPDDIDVPLILDLIEGYYLMVKSKIQVFKNKKKVTIQNMLKICQENHYNFDKKFQVYNDFREKGYIVSPGIKFGCDFAVYQRGPGIDHAPFLVQVYNRNENISSTDVVLAGRLATSVKKQFVLAIPYNNNRIDYIALDWWKA